MLSWENNDYYPSSELVRWPLIENANWGCMDVQANKSCKIPHITRGQDDLSKLCLASPNTKLRPAKSKWNQFRGFLSNFVQFGVKFLASCTSREYKVILFEFVRNLNCSLYIPWLEDRLGCCESGYSAHNLLSPAPAPSQHSETV